MGIHLARRHSLVLVQLLAPEELDPPVGGDVTLTDAETGEKLEITVGDRERAAYRARLEAHQARLREIALRRSMEFISLAADLPLEEAVWEHLLRRTSLAGHGVS